MMNVRDFFIEYCNIKINYNPVFWYIVNKMGQLKSHTRQLVAEVIKLMDEMSTVLVYDNHRLVGKISYEELVTFLNYKKDVGDVFYHKLNFELGTALHIIREMRTEKSKVTPEYVNQTLLARFISLAVLAAVLLGLAWWYYNPASSALRADSSNLIVSSEGIGADKAVLNLGADSNINLTDAAAGLIYTGPGFEIEKTVKGQLLYHLKDHGINITAAHSIRTPKGGSYEVMLVDGTKIWLNALSAIKFDAVPASASRRVSLTGEAYFEVTHDKLKPFVVSAKGQQIQVLGTHFNVHAYSDEAAARTTLLEGAVRVLAESTGQSVILKPGEQAIL
ncbi:MAG: hypothetical protein EOO88_25745, partial [Pedobacter sp.]